MKNYSEIISKAKEIIIKEISPEKIIIFGSIPLNLYNKDSDIDIFIIKNCKKEETRKYKLLIRKKLRELIFKYKISFDIFLDSKERFEKRLKTYNDQFYKEIINKGKIIYEK